MNDYTTGVKLMCTRHVVYVCMWWSAM